MAIQALLTAIESKPAKFERERGGVARPFDAAAPRALLARYRAMAELRARLAAVTAAREAAPIAAQVLAHIDGRYSLAREVARHDEGVARILAPAIAFYGQKAAARMRKGRAAQRQVRASVEAKQAAVRATEARDTADTLAQRAAAARGGAGAPDH